MDKDSVIENEMTNITKLVKSTDELECNHTLSPQAVCYADEIK